MYFSYSIPFYPTLPSLLFITYTHSSLSHKLTPLHHPHSPLFITHTHSSSSLTLPSLLPSLPPFSFLPPFLPPSSGGSDGPPTVIPGDPTRAVTAMSLSCDRNVLYAGKCSAVYGVWRSMILDFRRVSCTLISIFVFMLKLHFFEFSHYSLCVY